jgi:hypothetical protein
MTVLFSSGLTRFLAITLGAVMIFCSLTLAQQASPSLITQPVNESQLTVLKGNTHPLARPEFDLGTAPATLPMQRMLLVLKRSPLQESALRTLLDNQQDKSSPGYHAWLTPEQFGKQFGPTDADIRTITAWLQSHGFQVGSTKGRTALEFSGSASQVQEAFHTTIHKYLVKGEQHWANSSDPSIPTALTSAVAGVASLNNFPRRPMNRLVGQFTRDKTSGKIRPAAPLYTYQPGFQCSADDYCFALGPYDFATIYNVLPLWNTNVNGTGQTIAIVGESNINPQDVADFRTMFSLPANSAGTGNPLNIILNGPDPGLQGDEGEADIDVQWSGAVAPYATIDFVVSQSTETTAGIDLSAVYIVDNNLAGVMSESYGNCELGLGTSGNQFYNTLWQQAAAQGITVFISAGDNGAAGCDNFDASSPSPAQYGLEVSGYASTPYNVAVGGTDFNEFTNPELYWSVNNNPTTQASALGYIPETTWNSSCTNAVFGTFGFSTNAETNCNNPQLTPYYVVPVGGSGGASNCTTPSGSDPGDCAGGYAKPSWQTGTGVPSDGKRDLPDVSLFASNGFAGSFYIVCQSDQTYSTCNLSSDSYFLGFGGTSVSSPAFAGIMALVNQQTGSRQGNANYVFYKLAAKDSLSSCNSSASPASSCIFNDVTSGTNAMPCAGGSPNCTTSSGDLYGILTGYNAGTGYDQATGLGSVNANNLVTQWSSVTSLPSTTTLNSLTPTTITHGQPVDFSVTVKPQSGSGTPTGLISLRGGPSGSNNQGIGGFTLSSGTVSSTTELLPGGTYSVTAHYPGDSTYGPSDSSPISVTVNKENSGVQAFLVTFDSNGNILNSDATTAAYGSLYLLRVNVNNAAGQSCTPVSSTGATGCPTGSVTMTDNSTALDAGTYTLNSYGYFEDQTVQFPGGSNSVKAQYAGDNSFNGNTATQVITITPAVTTISAPITGSVQVGGPLVATAYINSSSNGVAPTGAVTFLANGSPISGSVSYSGWNGSPLAAQINAPNFPATAGTYTLTASYSGDANYSASTSSGSQITVQYAAPAVNFQVSSNNIAAGTPVTFTALIVGSSSGPNPTGTVQFSGQNSPPITAAVTYTPITVGGNNDLQAVVTFTPLGSDNYSAVYSGDSNYPTATGYAQGGSVDVTGNDFALAPVQPSVTVVVGQQVELTLFVDLQTNTAPVTFGSAPCSGLPAEATCTTVSPSVDQSSQVPFMITTTGSDAAPLKTSRSRRSPWWATTFAATFIGLFVLGLPSKRRRNLILPFLVIAFAFAMSSCGGGNSGGGPPPNQGTPAGSYTVTITATSGSGSAAITHTTTFQLVVQQ